MRTNRTSPMAPVSPYGSSVVGALTSPVNGDATPPPPVEAGTEPVQLDAGAAPSPGRQPDYGVDMPDPANFSEERLLRPESLTRKFDEAERRIRRQVTQQIERGVRVVPPVNISALEQGGYTTTSGSRIGYDLKRFAGQNPQGGRLGRAEGNTTGRGGPQGVTLTNATRMGGPSDPSGRDLLSRYTDSPSAASIASGMGKRGAGGANPQGLLNNARRLSRGY